MVVLHEKKTKKTLSWDFLGTSRTQLRTFQDIYKKILLIVHVESFKIIKKNQIYYVFSKKKKKFKNNPVCFSCIINVCGSRRMILK